MFRTIACREHIKHLAWAFCCSEHADCVRYKKTLAGEVIPPNMLPTGMMLQPDLSRA
jgi:hypothetical protein